MKLLKINYLSDFINYCVDHYQFENTTFICPGPQKADLIRECFDDKAVEAESVTISQFVKRQLIFCGINQEYTKKSELLLTLGAVWKRVGLSESVLEFKRSFNLLTDFRSYSTSQDVLESILEYVDPEISKGVLWMQRFLEELGLLDEHGAYQALTNAIQQEQVEPTPKARVVLFGFDHITGKQIDWLKSLDDIYDIEIPLYKGSFENIKSFDWPSWLELKEADILDVSSPLTLEKKIPSYLYTKNYLSYSMTSIQQKNSFESILLATPSLRWEYIQDLSVQKAQTKFAIEAFDTIYSKIKNSVELEFLNQKEISLVSFESLIQAKIEEQLKGANYRAVKVLVTLLRKTKEWSELSDVNISINWFDLSLLLESTRLDLPRINYADLSESGQVIEAVDGIENLSQEKNSLLVLNSQYSPITGIRKNYSENIEKYLCSIGPLRRAEFDKEIIKSKLKEYLSLNNVTILLERGQLEHDSFLEELFKDLNLDFLSTEEKVNKGIYEEDNRDEIIIDKISATGLQKYIDCPYKFYLTNLKRLSPKIKIEGHLDNFDVGNIQHLVIERYFNLKTSSYDESKLNELIKAILNQRKKLKSLDFQKAFVDIKTFVEKTILYLIGLKKQFGAEILFEVPFSNIRDGLKFHGSIDCLVQFNGYTLLLDFKRSNFSFKSLKSILEYEQIQLWFYLNQLNLDLKVDLEKVAIGYIDLSEIENSLIFCSSEDMKNDLALNSVKLNLKHIADFDKAIKSYREFELSMVTKLLEDRNFYPTPKNLNVCKYCMANMICSRGQNL